MCPLNHRLAKPLSISPVFSAVLSLMFLIVLGLGMTAFERTALAQDTGWELTVGAGYSMWLDSGVPTMSPVDAHVDHGFSIMLTGDYRFKDWFSFGFETSFIAGFPNDNYSHRDIESGNYWFGKVYLNETSAIVRFIWTNDSKDFEMYCKLGLGFTVGKLYPKNNEADDQIWFLYNIPIGVGLNYYFTDQLGIGLDVQYDFFLVDGFIRTMAHVAMRF